MHTGPVNTSHAKKRTPMKLKALLLLLSVPCCTSIAQNAYYDAVSIMKIDAVRNEFQQILSVYNDATSDEAIALRNLKKFMDNPFDQSVTPFDSDIFIVYNNAVDHLNTMDKDAHSLSQTSLRDLPIIGGVPAVGASEFATQTVSALTTLIIERAKVELTLSYFNKIRDEFEKLEITIGSNAARLKDLFPSSYQVLSTVDLFDYRNFGHVLQTGFKSDLSGLAERIDEKLVPEDLKKKDNYKLLRLGFAYVKLTKEGHNLPDVLNMLQDELGYDSGSQGSIEAAIKIASVLSENFRVLNPEGKQYWIRRDDLISLGSKGQKYLLGLIYQRNKEFFDKQFTTGVKPDVLFEQRSQVIELVSLFQNLDQELKAFRDVGGELLSQNTQNYFRILNRSFHIFFHAIKIEGICIGADLDKQFAEALPLTTLALEIGQAIREENYSVLLFNNLAIMRQLGIDTQNDVFRKGIQFASFAAEMLNAKTVEEKQRVLEASLLPPTSYRIKRTYSKTVYINAYLGFSAGREWLEQKEWAGHMSFFAPIGIEMARSTNESSYSLLFSVVDLGSIVSYRFESGEVDGIPEDFILKSVISPGVFFVHGFKNSPLSLGLGAQFTGDLRKVDDQRSSSIRLGLFLAADLTLFQLSAKE